MRVFDTQATLDRLPPAALIEALRGRPAPAADASQALALPISRTDPAAHLLVTAAGTPGRRFGVKAASIVPGNPGHGSPTVRAHYLLFDALTGTPLAQLDGHVLATASAAAAAALAAETQASEGAQRVALLGAGALARALLPALRCVRPIAEVVLWNRSPAAAAALAAELTEAGLAVRVADSAAQAVAGATTVLSATAATTPVLHAEWLAPGSFVALLGSAAPGQQEADAAALAAVPGARVFRSSGNADAELAAAELVFDAPLRQRPPRWFWEDFPVGMVQECGRLRVQRDAVLAFAQQFDPQPFHLDDDEAARSLFKKLSASGWHTCAMAMRLMCEGYLRDAASLGSPGMENLRWLQPVYPDDVLSLRFTVLAARPMASRPDVGLVRKLWEVHNQAGTPVLSMEGWGMFRRRPAAA